MPTCSTPAPWHSYKVYGCRCTSDREDETGVFFTNALTVETVRISAEHLSPNSPSKLQFVLPADVTVGEWQVAVTTQSTGSSTVLAKEVRRYVYPQVIRVE